MLNKITIGHYCPEWDYLYITPESTEWEACICEGLYCTICNQLLPDHKLDCGKNL